MALVIGWVQGSLYNLYTMLVLDHTFHWTILEYLPVSNIVPWLFFAVGPLLIRYVRPLNTFCKVQTSERASEQPVSSSVCAGVLIERLCARRRAFEHYGNQHSWCLVLSQCGGLETTSRCGGCLRCCRSCS